MKCGGNSDEVLKWIESWIELRILIRNQSIIRIHWKPQNNTYDRKFDYEVCLVLKHESRSLVWLQINIIDNEKNIMKVIDRQNQSMKYIELK